MSTISLSDFVESETNEYLFISKRSLKLAEQPAPGNAEFAPVRKVSSETRTMTSTYEPPKNAIYILLGEIQSLTSSKKNHNRWANNSIYEETTETNAFQKLKTILNSISDIRDIDSLTFLSPFLDIIRSDETSGPITCLALNSVNKFLCYGLIDNQSDSSSATIDKVANAVTHTRFVGTNPNDDEVVLMRILQVLRSLLLSPIGAKMTNESVCEILQACFRICFETRLSELLRKTSENVLVDMIQLLFARLPQLKEENSSSRADSSTSTTIENKVSTDDDERPTAIDSATHAIPPTDTTTSNLRPNENESNPSPTETSSEPITTSTSTNEYVNSTGIRFTTSATDKSASISAEALKPYGWPCVRDLLHFLTTLINQYDKNNTEAMMTVGLNLLTVAFEVGSDYLSSYPAILNIVKDVLCRNLLSMFHSHRLTLFSSSLRVSFLLFESLRTHLKYQFEFFISRLMELIVSEQSKVTNEQKEIALETIIQLFRIPGLPAELYLNYDCDLYSTNLFEDLTKMLSKNAFPVAGLTAIHILSLDALLSVIDHIELECQSQVQRQKHDAFGQALTRPISSGYALALSLQNMQISPSSASLNLSYETRLRQNRMSSSLNLPTHDHLKKLKQKKTSLIKGCEAFNQKPSSGLEFLQQKGLLSDPLNMKEVAEYLRNNPLLDKKVIGDYISNRKNAEILEEYVKTFHFENMRIDEALRIYLSEFRLPGEAPLIFNLLEHFAARWRECNNYQLATNDAAFGLAYACIMLNTDQHNANIRRQMPRMQCEDFIKNLSNMNDKENFDEAMLREIFRAIRSEEIVMPAEHTGLVRESYLWKSMIKRATTSNELFLHAPTGSYNYDIFTLIWGQTMAALSFVFEKSNYDLVIEKSIQGFSKCARIAAYYSMSDVFDNLVISLCKFTTLVNSREGMHRDFSWIETLPIQFGQNRKARLAATVVFNLAHVHGDILRDGWRNILECIIHLYKAKLLPSSLVEAEDLLDPSGRTSLIKEQAPQAPKNDTGLFSQLAYLLGGGSNDSNANADKQTTAEEQEAIKQATACIEQCHLDQMFQETKFLLIDSLNELLKALIYACQTSPDAPKLDQDVAVFSLEMLVRVVLQNRDRVTAFWSTIRNQFYAILVNANEKSFFVERTCVGLLRIAARLLRREELVSEVLDSLRILLLMKPTVLQTLASEIAFGLHELLRTDAANIHQSNDWFILFSLLEVVGACAPAPSVFQSPPTPFISKPISQSQSITNVDSDSECSDCLTNATATSDKGYTSDSEIYRRPDYVVVSHDDLKTMRSQQTHAPATFKPDLKDNAIRHDRRALIKCCEILSFLICDVAYVTADNFEYCIHCIRTFVEVTIAQHCVINNARGTTNQRKTNIRRVTSSNTLNTDYLTEQSTQPRGSTRNEYSDDDDGQESIRQEYQALALQLLELMYTLHTRASQVFKHLSNDPNRLSLLWYKCWCPILQGIARMCSDPRRLIRSSAFNYLQRSVLLPDLHSLPPAEWESMFTKVLFPLLLQLIDKQSTNESQFGFEEIRVRVSQLLCRIFLQHLTILLTLPTFTGLWLTILDFMDKYSKTDQTDTLRESVSESLKNMLLVMNTTNLFDLNEQLTTLTKERIHSFLPGLWDEVFKAASPPASPQPTVALNSEEKPSVSEATTNSPPQEPIHPEPTVPINEKIPSLTMDE